VRRHPYKDRLRSHCPHVQQEPECIQIRVAEVTGKAFRIESEPGGLRKFEKPRTGRIALLALAALGSAAAFVIFGLPGLVKPERQVTPQLQPTPAESTDS